MAYGRDTLPEQLTYVIKNVTAWTNEDVGVLKNATVIIEKGKITFDKKYEIIKYLIEDIPPICPNVSYKYDDYTFYASYVVIMSDGRYLAYGEQSETGETGYGFRRIPRWDEQWNHDGRAFLKLVLSDDSDVLPPFVKHTYPSYEYTEKKQKPSGIVDS